MAQIHPFSPANVVNSSSPPVLDRDKSSGPGSHSSLLWQFGSSVGRAAACLCTWKCAWRKRRALATPMHRPASRAADRSIGQTQLAPMHMRPCSLRRDHLGMDFFFVAVDAYGACRVRKHAYITKILRSAGCSWIVAGYIDLL